MKTFPNPLTPAKERECLERLKEGDQEARRLLIEHNMRLVAHVVKKYNIPIMIRKICFRWGPLG